MTHIRLIVAVCLLGIFGLTGCEPAPVAPSSSNGNKELPQAATPTPSDAATSTAESGATMYEGVGYALPLKAGKYEILGIRTDNKDSSAAKTNAQASLLAHPDIACMVGLWAYNPPAILSALEDAGKIGQVKVVGFDEHPETLQAISDGKVIGTIVQQPYLFGFKSVEYLSALARKQEVKIPEDKMLYIPHTTVTADNVLEFKANIEKINAGEGDVPASDRNDYDITNTVKLSFITNSIDPFWVLAQQGCKKAEPVFNAKVDVIMPSNGTVEQQKQSIETFINNGGQGLAISPINPANQVDMINQAAAVMPVLCQDSDAPESNRLFYLGTSNYQAGRAAGKLVKQALPEGGKVMIFVGKLEVLNAQERSRGVIEELMEKPE
ncbi:MAG: D-ribose-binding periplasmic protein precursor [Planctomycetota bacterium]|jgi:ribose transport system substrate-binding protein